jgi:hypothetical protein
MLHFTLLSALNERNYAIALQVPKEFAKEVPWEQMSQRLLRRIFEVSIVADELTVAQRALNELSIKTLVKASQGEALQCLVDWRAGRIADESALACHRRRASTCSDVCSCTGGCTGVARGAMRLIRERSELPGDRTPGVL